MRRKSKSKLFPYLHVHHTLALEILGQFHITTPNIIVNNLSLYKLC